jgi:hypothetical protein
MTKLELTKKVIENINEINTAKKNISSYKEECLEKYIEFDLSHESTINNMFDWSQLGKKGTSFIFRTFKKEYIESFCNRTTRDLKFLVEVERYLVDIIREDYFRVIEGLESDYETQISIPVNYSSSEWIELQDNKALEEKQYRQELINEESPF